MEPNPGQKYSFEKMFCCRTLKNTTMYIVLSTKYFRIKYKINIFRMNIVLSSIYFFNKIFFVQLYVFLIFTVLYLSVADFIFSDSKLIFYFFSFRLRTYGGAGHHLQTERL